MNKRIKMLIHLVIVAVLVAIDQFTKYLVRTYLVNGREIIVFKGVFKIVSHRNTGAVWGILQGKTLGLAIFTFFIMAIIVYLYIRMPWDRPRLKYFRAVLVLLTAGAIGNLIDRLLLGSVVDFLYFELINFPVFNIADCYVTVTEILLIILLLFYYKEDDLDFILPHREGKKKVSAEKAGTETEGTETADDHQKASEQKEE